MRLFYLAVDSTNLEKKMNTISAQIVKNIWQQTADMSPFEAPKLVNKLAKQQPIIIAFLMAAGHDVFNQDERELLLYLGINIWKMMSQGEAPIPKITEKILEKCENNNYKLLEYLDSETAAGYQNAIELIFENYRQPEILKYIIEALFENSDENANIRDKVKGLIMLHLKTVLDCLDS
jgi:predicted RNA-binding protein